MDDLTLWTPVVWFLVGVVCAAYIVLDMRKHDRMQVGWAVVGFFLSGFGLVLYLLLVKFKRPAYQYPPKPEYSAPEYKTEKPAAPAPEAEKKPEKQVEQVEGIPRCPNCGAAISAHDVKCPKCGYALR